MIKKRPTATILTPKQQKELREKAANGVRLRDLMSEYRIGNAKLYATLNESTQPEPEPKKPVQPSKPLRETFGGAQAASPDAEVGVQTIRLSVGPKTQPAAVPQVQNLHQRTRNMQYESEIGRLKGLVVELAQEKSDLGLECRALKSQLASMYQKQAGRI